MIYDTLNDIISFHYNIMYVTIVILLCRYLPIKVKKKIFYS